MPPPSPRKTSPPQRGASPPQQTSPKKAPPASAPSKRSPPPPAKSASASALRGGGGRKGAAAGAGGKKRSEQAILDNVNNETIARQVVIQDYFAELSQLQGRYEADGKRAKDSYISILERRLAQAHAAARIRVDAMEEKFQAVLTSISRLLVETYQLGAIGITDGVVLSDMSPAPIASLAATAGVPGGSASFPLDPLGGGVGGSASPNTVQSFAGRSSTARIASPFSLGGGGAASAGNSAMATPRPAAVNSSPLLSDNEEKIRRFFVNPQTPEATKLEVIDVRELCARVDELRDGVTGLVSQCVTKLSTSIYRVKNLEHALDDQSLCLASAERLLQNSIVKSDNANQSAIQLCRSLGIDVQDKWNQLSGKLIATLDALIRDTVDTCLDHREHRKQKDVVRAFNYRPLNEGGATSSAQYRASSSSSRRSEELDKEMLVTDFTNDLDGIRLFQSDILRSIREKILAFQRNMMQDHVLEHAKLFRSNIPEEYRRVLHCCEVAFDRQALLQVLDRVSFEPAAAEIIIAVTQAFVAANGGLSVVEDLIMTKPGEDSVVVPRSNDTAAITSTHGSFEVSSPLLGPGARAVGSAGTTSSVTSATAVVVAVNEPSSPRRKSPPPSARVIGSAEAKRKMLYAQALNSVAFTAKGSSLPDDEELINQSLEKLSPRAHRPGQRQELYSPLGAGTDSASAHLHKNDGVLSTGIGLTTAVNRLKAGLSSKQQQQQQVHRSPLHFVPVSEILNPSSSVDVYPNRVHTLINHPEAVGVVAPAHRMFVPSVTSGYVSSVVKERMELEKTMKGVLEERQAELDILSGGGGKALRAGHGEDPPHVVRLLPSMTPGMKRRVLLDVLSGDDGIVATSSPPPSQRDAATNALVPRRPPSSGSSNHLASRRSGEESTQVVVTSRLSARFSSSASLKRDRDAAAAQATQEGSSASALLQGPKAHELEALGIRRPAVEGVANQPRPMPAAARLYSEKQRSLLQQLLECDGESTRPPVSQR